MRAIWVAVVVIGVCEGIRHRVSAELRCEFERRWYHWRSIHGRDPEGNEAVA